MEWLRTPTGRKFTTAAATIIGTGCFSAFLIPHSYLLHKTKGFLQMYKDGEPLELPDDLLKKAKKVLQETTLSQREKNNVAFFTTFGSDVSHAGSTQLKQGSIIGIPLTYKYKSLSDINPDVLAIHQNEGFSWKSDLGQQILTTLLMSNRAQQFSIAREIYYTNTNCILFTSIAATTNFLATFTGGQYLNKKLNLYGRPLRYRLFLYSILSSIGIVMFFFMKDHMNVQYEAYADEMAANLGKSYVLGGIEYYEYMLERNKALREALGNKGKKLFTPGGNVKEIIRVTQIPLTSRFAYMKQRLIKLEENPTELGVAPVNSIIVENTKPSSVLSTPLLDKDVPI